MLPGAEARRPNQSGETISDDDNRFIAGVLVRDHGSERKTSDGVAGGKRVAAVEKVYASVAFQGPLAAGSGFENFRDNQTVHQRLGSKQSRVAQFRLLGQDS